MLRHPLKIRVLGLESPVTLKDPAKTQTRYILPVKRQIYSGKQLSIQKGSLRYEFQGLEIKSKCEEGRYVKIFFLKVKVRSS